MRQKHISHAGGPTPATILTLYQTLKRWKTKLDILAMSGVSTENIARGTTDPGYSISNLCYLFD